MCYSCSEKSYNLVDLNTIKAKLISKNTNNEAFIPKEDYTPLTVRVNFILLLDENGEGNFRIDNDEDNEILDNVFQKSNHLYANLKDPKDSICYKGNDFLSDTKIRLAYKKYYVKDTFARNYLNAKGYSEEKRNINLISPSPKWYLKTLDNAINDTITKKGINVYNTMNVPAYNQIIKNKTDELYDKTKGIAISQLPSLTDLNRSSQLHYPNLYTKKIWMKNFYGKSHNISWKKLQRTFELIHKGLSHELGHSFGLLHGNQYHRTNKCFNAMMNQNYRSPRNYIQPSEIGKMHKLLMMTNLIQYVTEDSNYNVPKIISENENWDFKTLRFYQDIIVKKDQILILNGTVIFPKKASITLEKNATLILNKATLKTSNNKKFTHIIKRKDAKVIRY
jgi:hypothetical protein